MSRSETITIVLVGCHASGKTTLAQRLSQIPNFDYYTEVGAELRERSKCRTSQSCPIFDELVMFRELERDKILLESLQERRNLILEQWHIGNIAYARVRSPQVASEYLSRLQASKIIQQLSPTVFFLDIDPIIIGTRVIHENIEQREEEILFYSHWRNEIEQTFSELNIVPVRINATGLVSEIYTLISSNLF